MLGAMSGPLLGAVVLNLAGGGVSDPAERLERIYEWRVARTAGWIKALVVAIAATAAPLLIDVATSGDSVDGTGRFFLAVAIVALGALIVGVSVRLQRLEAEYATAQALLAAFRAGAPGTPPAPPGPPPGAGPALTPPASPPAPTTT